MNKLHPVIQGALLGIVGSFLVAAWMLLLYRFVDWFAAFLGLTHG